MKKIVVLLCMLLLAGCVVKEPEVKTGAVKPYDLASRDFEIVETADVFMVGMLFYMVLSTSRLKRMVSMISVAWWKCSKTS